MRLFICVMMLLTMAGAAAAAEPGYFRVTGVKAGDVLNIRAEPKPAAEAVGELAPGAGPVEILEVETSGGSEWGRMVAGDTNGWVAMRFLEPVELETVGDTSIPDGLSCGGSEPFWGVEFSKDRVMQFSTMVGLELNVPITLSTTAISRTHRFAVKGESQGHLLTAMVGRNEVCLDGMSEGNYGWRIDLLLEKPGDGEYPQQFEGCCSLRTPG